MHIGLNLILVIVLTARNNTYHNWNLLAQLNLVLVQIIARDNKQARNQTIASRNNSGPRRNARTGAYFLKQ